MNEEKKNRFPKHFQISYQKYYSYKNLDPIVISLFILFMIIYIVTVYFKLN
jgi:hypothetical protein